MNREPYSNLLHGCYKQQRKRGGTYAALWVHSNIRGRVTSSSSSRPISCIWDSFRTTPRRRQSVVHMYSRPTLFLPLTHSTVHSMHRRVAHWRECACAGRCPFTVNLIRRSMRRERPLEHTILSIFPSTFGSMTPPVYRTPDFVCVCVCVCARVCLCDVAVVLSSECSCLGQCEVDSVLFSLVHFHTCKDRQMLHI